MTTTTSSDGTPEPQPDGDGGTLGEPAGQGGDSGGNQTSPTADSSQQGDADPGSARREGFWARAWAAIAEALGLTSGGSWRRRAVVLLAVASISLVAAFRDALIDYFMTKPNVTRENDANTEYDASKLPFTVSVQPDGGDPRQPWVMVLDRELTAAEARKLTSSNDSSVTFSYLKSLGGRPLEDPSVLEDASKKQYIQHMWNGRTELSDTFKMTVLSTRAAAVVIDNWKVTDVVCRESTAQAVIALPGQGEAAYQGIQLHIPARADEPVLTDDTDGQGEPYFDTHYIEVGGGQPSGGLRVEAIARPGQTCEWGVKVHYVDAYQKAQWLQLKDRTGKPLRLRTESVPLHPRQRWIFGSIPWTPCHLKPEVPECALS
ncbi:hypothetical protein [Streptomyces spiralis]